MADTHFPPNWQQRLLAVLNARGFILDNPAGEVFRLLTAWARCEGGSARWNPLNTTYPIVGSTQYNEIGVRNYRWPIDGICATALTLCTRESDQSLRYGGILGAMQATTKTAEEIVRANRAEFERWGTDTDLMLKVLEEL